MHRLSRQLPRRVAFRCGAACSLANGPLGRQIAGWEMAGVYEASQIPGSSTLGIDGVANAIDIGRVGSTTRLLHQVRRGRSTVASCPP
jgi:hypothetical protein